MRVSIEWFFIDNLLMNWLMLHLGSSLSGLPIRKWHAWMTATFGSVYALASVLWLPWLSAPIPKLALSMLMAFPMIYHRNDVLRAILFLLLAACLMGGLMLCLCILLGGSYVQGMLIGTLPVRSALIGIVLCALLPRTFRSVRKHQHTRMLHIPLQIRYQDMTVYLTALIDSGNLLTEPISQKPIIILRSGMFGHPFNDGRPVTYQSVGGSGVLYAVEAEQISLFVDRWYTVDAMIAESNMLSASDDAILPMILLPEERIGQDAETCAEMVAAAVRAPNLAAHRTGTVHTFGRNLAGTLSGRRRTGVDQTIDDGGTGSEECADRA